MNDDPRPDYCCGKCPPIVGGGFDCTCRGNPRCENYEKSRHCSKCGRFMKRGGYYANDHDDSWEETWTCRTRHPTPEQVARAKVIVDRAREGNDARYREELRVLFEAAEQIKSKGETDER
jgi:hypothetical protein